MSLVFPEAVVRVLNNHQEDIAEDIDNLKKRLEIEKKRLISLEAGKNIVGNIDALNLSDEQKAAALEVFGDVVGEYNEHVSIVGRLMSLIDKVQVESNIVASFIKEHVPPVIEPCSPPTTEEQMELLPQVQA